MSQPVPPEHGPAKFSTYFSIHENRMDGFRSRDFVGEDSLEFTFLEAGILKIEGEISCLGNIVIRVENASSSGRRNNRSPGPDDLLRL